MGAANVIGKRPRQGIVLGVRKNNGVPSYREVVRSGVVVCAPDEKVERDLNLDRAVLGGRQQAKQSDHDQNSCEKSFHTILLGRESIARLRPDIRLQRRLMTIVRS